MADSKDVGDESAAKPKDVNPVSEKAIQKAATNQDEITAALRTVFRQIAELNESITGKIGAVATEVFTLVGLEGEGGKGAAVSEKAERKPGGGDSTAGRGGGDGEHRDEVDGKGTPQEGKPETAADRCPVDLTKVLKDADDHIYEINYPGGSTRDIFRDEHGNITDVTYKNNKTGEFAQWSYDSTNKKFYRYDETGQLVRPPQTLEPPLQVDDKSGNFSYRKPGSDHRVTEKPDGAVVESNEDGQVVQVTTRDGTTTYHYDGPPPNGKVDQLTEPDGTTWKRDGDGFHCDKDGIKSTHVGTISVQADGTEVWQPAGAGEKNVYYTNGVEVTCAVDDQGKEQVKEVDHPSGDTTSLEYNSQGEVCKVTATLGSESHTYSRKTDGTWDDPTIKDITATANGTAVVEYTDGRKWTYYADQSNQIEYPNGRVEHINGEGELSSVDTPGRRELVADPDGGFHYKVRDKDNFWVIAEDTLRAQGSQQPSSAEIIAEAERIANASGKEPGSVIHTKDILKIPPAEAPAVPEKAPEAGADKEGKGAEGSIAKLADKAAGKQEQDLPDGSCISRKEGYISVLGPPTGDPPLRDTRLVFGFDGHGEVNYIMEPNGDTWDRVPPSKEWTKQGTGEKFTGEISVVDDPKTGVLTYTDISTREKVTLNPDGSQIHEKDGLKRTDRTDGTSVTEKDDLVIKVEGPAHGKPLVRDTRTFGYDQDKDGHPFLSHIAHPDGATWRRDTGEGAWIQTAPPEKKGTRWEGDPQLSEDGTLSWIDRRTQDTVMQYADGSKIVEHADKSTIWTDAHGHTTKVKDADGKSTAYGYDEAGKLTTKVTVDADKKWTFTENPDGSKMRRDAAGYVTEFKTPDGPAVQGQMEFKYDSQHKLIELKSLDGTYWKEDPSTHKWTQYKDEAASEPTGQVLEKPPQVNKDTGTCELDYPGNNRWIYEPTGTMTFVSSDNSQTAYNRDGSAISKNKEGQVTQALDANGKRTEYGYDGPPPNGQLNCIKKSEPDHKQDSVWRYDKSAKCWKSEDGQKFSGEAIVTPDGTLHYKQEGRGEVLERTDGKKEIYPATGGKRVETADGKILELTTAHGDTYKFEYNPGATSPYQVAKPDGTVLSLVGFDFEQGAPKWEATNPATGQHSEWYGNITVSTNSVELEDDKEKVTVQLDGTRKIQDNDLDSQTYGKEATVHPDGTSETRPEVNREAMKEVAEDINAKLLRSHQNRAMNPVLSRLFSPLDASDFKDICALLADKSEAERKVIDQIYRQEYGKSLLDDMSDLASGSDLETFKNALYHKDTERVTHQEEKLDYDDPNVMRNLADTLHETFLERSNIWDGRSNAAIEKWVRDEFSHLTSEQIARLASDYQRAYGSETDGGSLREAIEKSKLPQETKDAVEIYLKGVDKRTDADSLKLADIAMTHKNFDMFAEVMTQASPEARSKFMEKYGEEKIWDAFAINYSRGFEALDYARLGKLSEVTQVFANVGLTSLGTNKDAIANAFKNMSDEDRRLYLMGKAVAEGKDALALLPGDQQRPSQNEIDQASKYYDALCHQMLRAGNEADVARWEALIASKDSAGSLVDRIAQHRGLYNDSIGEVMHDIEKMSKEDWERLRNNPAYFESVVDAIASLKGFRISQDDIERALKLLGQKMGADDFEKSKEYRRDVESALKDSGSIRDDLDALGHMTKEEREKCRNNTDGFRETIGGLLRHSSSQRDMQKQQGDICAISRILAIVDKGVQPPEIFLELNQAAVQGTDHAQLVRDIEEAFEKDPTLRERINHPGANSAEDQVLAQQFKEAGLAVFGSEGYERYVKPVIEMGRLPMDKQMELSSGIVSADRKGGYADLERLAKAATMDQDPQLKERMLHPKTAEDEQLARQFEDAVKERQKILTDKDYQEKVFQSVFGSDKEDRDIALRVLKDGVMAPEDKLRTLMNHWSGQADVMEVLRELKPEDIQKVEHAYKDKYKRDLDADLFEKLSVDDKKEAIKILESNRSMEEQYELLHTQYSESRSGWGSSASDYLVRGTPAQVDDAINQLTKKVGEANERFQTLTPEQAKELLATADTALDAFRESKAGTADAVENLAILGASIVFSGGAAGVSLLARMAVAGAIMKVAAKEAFMGSDYDATVGQVVKDVLTGGMEAAVATLGPEQFSAIAGVGEKAALEGAEATLARLGEKEAAQLVDEEVLKKGAKEAMSNFLVGSGKEVDEAVVKEAVEAAVKPVGEGFTKEARDQLVKEVTEGLKKDLLESAKKETDTLLKAAYSKGRELALHGFAGGSGAAASAGFEATLNWDLSKGWDENLTRVFETMYESFKQGVAMSACLTLGFKALHLGSEALKNLGKEPPHFAQDADIHVNGHKLPNIEKGEAMTVGKANFEGAPDPKVADNHATIARDKEGHVLLMDTSEEGTYVKHKGSDKFTRYGPGQTVAIGPGDEIRLGSEKGPELELEEISKGGAAAQPPDAAVEKGPSTLVETPSSPPEVPKVEAPKPPERTNMPPDDVTPLEKPGARPGPPQLPAEARKDIIGYDSKGGAIFADGTAQNRDLLSVPIGQFDQEFKPVTIEETVDGKTVRRQFYARAEDVDAEGAVKPDAKLYKAADQRRLGDGTVPERDDAPVITQDGKLFLEEVGPKGRQAPRDAATIKSAETDTPLKRPAPADSRESPKEAEAPRVKTPVEAKDSTTAPVEETGEPREASSGLDSAKSESTLEARHPDELSAEGSALLDVAKSHLSDEKLGRFQDMMQAFELRVKMGEIPRTELAETYGQVERLLSTEPREPLTAIDQARIAEQIMYQSAYPSEIDQGSYATCPLTTLEKRLYTNEPSKAAKMVVDVVTTRQYVTVDGAVIKMDESTVRGALGPDGDASIGRGEGFRNDGRDIKQDNVRSEASQIFQMTAANIHWQTQALDELGEPIFVYGKATPGDAPPGHQPPLTDERIIDRRTGTPLTDSSGHVLDSPELGIGTLPELNRKITGRADTECFLFNSTIPGSEGTAATGFASAEELGTKLADLKEQGKLPAIVMVDSGKLKLGESGSSGGAGSWHVINVQDYDPRTGKVYSTNQWGREADRMGDEAMSLHEFYELTKAPQLAPVEDSVTHPRITTPPQVPDDVASPAGGEPITPRASKGDGVNSEASPKDTTPLKAPAQPRDASAGLKPGDPIQVTGGKPGEVLGSEREFLIVRSKHAPPPAGEGFKVTDDQLKSKYTKVGDTGYYGDGEGRYYRLREKPDGTKSLAEDVHVFRAERPDPIRFSDAQSLRADARTPLANAEKVESFHKEVSRVVDGWDKVQMQKESMRLREAAIQQKTSEELARESIRKEMGFMGTVHFDEPVTMREQLKNKPELLEQYEKYLAARDSHAQIREEIAARYKPLEDAINRFAEADNLPKISLKFESELDGRDASYLLGKGIIAIKDVDLTVRANREKFFDTLMHEFTHNEQDSLVVRTYAEQLGVKGKPTDAQIQAIQERYSENMKETVSKEYVKKVLEASKNRLSPDDLKRALEFQNRPSLDLDPKVHSLRNEFNIVQSASNRLGPDKSAWSLIEKLEKGELNSKTLFGSAGLPEEVGKLIEKYRGVATGQLDKGAWSDAEAQKTLKLLLGTRLERLKEEVYQVYRNLPKEKEAHAVGELARRQSGGEVSAADPIQPPRSGALDTGSMYIPGDKVDFEGKRYNVVEVDKKEGIVSLQESPGTRVKEVFAEDLPPKDQSFVTAPEPRAIGTDEVHKLPAEATPAARPNDAPGSGWVKMDEATVGQLRKEFGLGPSDRFSEDQLDQIEKRAGKALEVDKDGNLYTREAGAVQPDTVGKRSLGAWEKLQADESIPESIKALIRDHPLFEYTHGGIDRDELAELILKYRVYEHPLFQPGAVKDFVGRVKALTSEWEGKGLSIAQKTEKLQEMVDEFAKGHGPTAKIEIMDKLPDGGAGEYQDGVIRIKTDYVADGADPGMLVDRLYHEFTHNYQDGLVIRNLNGGREDLPEIGLRKSDLSALFDKEGQLRSDLFDQKGHLKSKLPADVESKIKQLQERYRAQTGYDVSDRHLAEVLRAADDKPLSDTEIKRAAKIEEALLKYPLRKPELLEALKAAEAAGDWAKYRELHNQALREYLKSANEVEALIIGRNAALTVDSGTTSADTSVFTSPDPFKPESPTLTGRETGEAKATGPFSLDFTRAKPEDILEAAGIDKSRWEKVLAGIRESALANPKALKDFDREFEKLLRKLDSISESERSKLSHLTTEADKTEKKLWSELDTLEGALKRRARVGSKAEQEAVAAWLTRRDPATLAQIKETFKGDPTVESLMKRVITARDENGIAQKALSDALKPRMQALQDLLDTMALKYGLPKVNVGMMSGFDTTGEIHGLYNDGNLYLKRSHILRSDTSPDLFRLAVYHEFVHNEQDYLVLRSILDDLDTHGKTISTNNVDHLLELAKKARAGGGSNALTAAEQKEIEPLADLLKAYQAKTGKSLSDDHLIAVLEAREGGRTPDEPRRLTPEKWKLSTEERARADNLANSFKNKVPLDESYQQARNNLPWVNKALNAVSEEGGSGTARVLKTLAEDSKHADNWSERLFGSQEPPPEVKQQIDEWRAKGMPAVADQEATKVLQQFLQARKAFPERRFQEYLASLHETEAFIIPSLLAEPARAPGPVLEKAAVEPTSALDSSAGGRPRSALRPEMGDAMFAPPKSQGQTLEPPVLLKGRVGDTVNYKGTACDIVAADARGQAVLHQDGRRVSIKPTPVAPDELGNFQKLEIGGQSFYADSDGNVYKLLKRPVGTDLLMPQKDYFIPQDVQPIEGYKHPIRVEAGGKGDFLSEDTEIVIGSDPDYGWNRSSSPKPGEPSWSAVDSEHAAVGRDKMGLYIQDLHSQNGTYLKRDGASPFEPIPPGEKIYLQPGDRIRLGDVNGPEVAFAKAAKVEGNDSYKPLLDSKGNVVEYGSQRTFEVDGKKYRLERRAHDPAKWFYPEDARFKGGMETPVKVHVNVESPEKLAELQAVLIPALHDDPELQKLVANWKTMDPRFGVGEPDAIGPEPTGRDQKAKGFTIYAKSTEDARKIVERIDEILKGHPELKLDQPLPTGNVDVIPSNSEIKRVGWVRDRFDAAVDANGELAVKIDDALRAKIDQEFPPLPGESPDQRLRRLEQATGIKPGSLSHDSQGDLILEPSWFQYQKGGELKEHVGARMAPGGNAYVDEGSADKRWGNLTDRPALYSLYSKFGVDPADLASYMEKPGKRLTSSELVDLSARVGITPPNKLAYGKDGKLAVVAAAPARTS